MTPIPTQTFWNSLIALALLLGTGLIMAGRVQPTDHTALPSLALSTSQDPAPVVGHPAPNFSLTTVTGSQLSLDELRGQVVLVNIWATWCPPCRAEMPAIQATYEQYRDQGFTVVAVNQQETAEIVQHYLAEQRLTFPTVLDTDASVAVAYQARVLPSSFFIDRQGIVRVIYRGPLPRGVIDGTVRGLLAETEPVH